MSSRSGFSLGGTSKMTKNDFYIFINIMSRNELLLVLCLTCAFGQLLFFQDPPKPKDNETTPMVKHDNDNDTDGEVQHL